MSAVINSTVLPIVFNSTQTISFTSMASGNTLLVQVQVGNTGLTLTSIQTNLGANLTLDYTAGFSQYYRISNVASGTTSVTITRSGNDNVGMQALECTGLANAGPDYTDAPANTNGFNAINTHTIVIPNAGDLVFGDFDASSAISSVTPTVTYGGSPLNNGRIVFYGNISTAGSQTLTITRASSASQPISIVSYAAASGSYYLSDMVEM